MMKYRFLALLLFLSSYGLTQVFDHEEGRFYEQPGDNIVQSMDAEYFNEEFQVTEKKRICRETQWVRKYHQGNVWVPVHTSGTWKTVRKDGYFWTLTWSDWYFCEEN